VIGNCYTGALLLVLTVEVRLIIEEYIFSVTKANTVGHGQET